MLKNEKKHKLQNWKRSVFWRFQSLIKNDHPKKRKKNSPNFDIVGGQYAPTMVLQMVNMWEKNLLVQKGMKIIWLVPFTI